MKQWLKKNKNKFVFIGLLVIPVVVSAATDPVATPPATPAPTDTSVVSVSTQTVMPTSTPTPTSTVTPPVTDASANLSVATAAVTPPSADTATVVATTLPTVTPPAVATSSVVTSASTPPSVDASAAPAAVNPDTEKGMIKEESPEVAKIVISEAVQAVLKESSTVMENMEQELAESNKLLEELRTQHRGIDKELDAFYEKTAGILGRLVRSGDRLKSDMDKKNELFNRQAYATASQLITKLQAIMPQLGDYKGVLDKLKGAHKEIDVTEEQIRAKISALTGAFSDAAKLVQESSKLRHDILTAVDEAKAKEVLAKLQVNLTTIKNKKNEFKDGPGKEILGFITRIKEQMKSLEDQAVVQDTKIKGLQAEVDALVLPKSDVPVKVEPLVDKEPVKQENVIVHKKVKIPEKSMIRLSLESVGQAFADVYQTCKSGVSTVVSSLFGPRKKETIEVDKGIKVEAITEKAATAPANASIKSAPVIVSSISEERKQYIELMQQERQAQLARIKEIDEKLKVHGVEIQSA